MLVIDHPVGNPTETEPPVPRKSGVAEPPFQNQSLQPGASQSKWENTQPLDLPSPNRREQLHHAALAAGVIPSTEAYRRTFLPPLLMLPEWQGETVADSSAGLLRHLPITGSLHRPTKTNRPFGLQRNNAT